MQKYIFILGKSSELSLAEIVTAYPNLKLLQKTAEFSVYEGTGIDLQEAQERLGGTIKVGIGIATTLDKSQLKEQIVASRGPSERKNFGFSWYGVKPDQRLGMNIKKELRSQGISCRLVESREPQLSSVIITKEKCLDFLVLPGLVGVTVATQDFRDYSERDFGRPKSDALSGMLPPKLAKMMVNLSGLSAKTDSQAMILDPFCGSGTILSEALSLGFRNLKGCDLSNKAVDDSAANIDWLINGLQIKKYDLEIFNCDARKLSEKVEGNSIDAIVTEPYLGKPIKGFEKESEIKKIVSELEDLYLIAFKEFKKVLKKGGRAVVVIPEWHLGEKVHTMKIFDGVMKMGFQRLDDGDLIYKREGQRVWRNITVWEL